MDNRELQIKVLSLIPVLYQLQLILFSIHLSQPGEFLYHCIIHPWRVASVSASDAYFTGEDFKIDIGSGAVWDITTHPRVLLDIEPQTIPLDRTTPITYNVTINDGENNEKIFLTFLQLLVTPFHSS